MSCEKSERYLLAVRSSFVAIKLLTEFKALKIK